MTSGSGGLFSVTPQTYFDHVEGRPGTKEGMPNGLPT